MKFFSRQKYDDAGKTGVVIQKLVIFLLVAELLNFAFSVGAGFWSLFSSVLSVSLLCMAFHGAHKRNPRVLRAYFAINISLIVAFFVAVAVLFAVIAVVYSSYEYSSYSSYPSYSANYPEQTYSWETSVEYYSNLYNNAYGSSSEFVSSFSTLLLPQTSFLMETENGGFFLYTAAWGNLYYFFPISYYSDIYSSFSSLTSTIAVEQPALSLVDPIVSASDSIAPIDPSFSMSGEPATSWNYWTYYWSQPRPQHEANGAVVILAVLALVFGVVVFACKIAVLALSLKMSRQLLGKACCKSKSLPVTAKPAPVPMTSLPNGGAYYIVVPQGAAMPENFPNMQQPFYYVQPNSV
jgi:hypothetical protein